MDNLMIHWNSVWTNSRRDTMSLLADHGRAEMKAYERVLHPSKGSACEPGTPYLEGRTWTGDLSKPPRVTNRPRPLGPPVAGLVRTELDLVSSEPKPARNPSQRPIA